MPYDNGRLPATALTIVQPGMRLATTTARAWLALVAAARAELGRTIAIAGPAGAYRSYAVQAAMRTASLGRDVAAKQRWGLSTVSTAPLAAAGFSKHGDGLCVDVIGTPIDGPFVALARRHGFTFPIPGDPNHMIHDGKTVPATSAVKRPAVKPAGKSSGKTVVVKAGETLAVLAAAHGTTWRKLATLNGISDPNRIAVGQKLRVS